MTDILKFKAVLTLAEAAEYMGLKKSYLYRLTHEKRIRHYKPNNKKIYFKVDDIIAWLTSNPILTDEELSEQAQSYCMGSRKITSCDNLIHDLHDVHHVGRKGGAL